MKETGLIFKAPLVRAILNGQKTQTRRICKLEVATDDTFMGGHYLKLKGGMNLAIGSENVHIACPTGGPGDRIYVRETWQHANFPLGPYQEDTTVFYRADYMNDPHGPDGEKSPEGKYRHWSPAIHMPKAAARIWLEVTGVRMERLQQITEADCIAEGAAGGHGSIPGYVYSATPLEHFRHIWESTSGDWEANPWVWVTDFKPITHSAL